MRALTLSETEMLVVWTEVADSSDAAVNFYTLEVCQSTFPEAQLPASFLAQTPGDQTELLLEGLEEYVQYSVRVRAETDSGPGPYSAPVSNTTLQAGW